jgi:hypothetical protein
VTDCRFTRPDGAVLLPREGLGNANYSYFGNGFSKGECGLTIHKIQEVDKGLWNCTVSDRSTQRSGFLNVSTKCKFSFLLEMAVMKLIDIEMDAMQTGQHLPTFRRRVLPSS